MAWYFVDDLGSSKGPVEESELLQLRAQGSITGSTLVWTQGRSDWLPLDQAFTPSKPTQESTSLKGSPLSTLWLVVLVSAGLSGLFLVVAVSTIASYVAGAALFACCVGSLVVAYVRKKRLRTRLFYIVSLLATITAGLAFFLMVAATEAVSARRTELEASLRTNAAAGDVAGAADAYESLAKLSDPPTELLREFKPLLAGELEHRRMLAAAAAKERSIRLEEEVKDKESLLEAARAEKGSRDAVMSVVSKSDSCSSVPQVWLAWKFLREAHTRSPQPGDSALLRKLENCRVTAGEAAGQEAYEQLLIGRRTFGQKLGENLLKGGYSVKVTVSGLVHQKLRLVFEGASLADLYQISQIPLDNGETMSSWFQANGFELVVFSNGTNELDPLELTPDTMPELGDRALEAMDLEAPLSF